MDPDTDTLIRITTLVHPIESAMDTLHSMLTTNMGRSRTIMRIGLQSW